MPLPVFSLHCNILVRESKSKLFSHLMHGSNLQHHFVSFWFKCKMTWKRIQCRIPDILCAGQIIYLKWCFLSVLSLLGVNLGFISTEQEKAFDRTPVTMGHPGSFWFWIWFYWYGKRFAGHLTFSENQWWFECPF